MIFILANAGDFLFFIYLRYNHSIL